MRARPALSTVVAGNIGNAVLDVLAEHEDGAAWPDLFVLELSSYQLETTTSLQPAAATVLNVSPNHLDRYAGIADYAAAKGAIFANAAVQVLNRDDAIVRLMRLPGRTVQTFGASVPLSEEEWGLRAAGGRRVARARRRAAGPRVGALAGRPPQRVERARRACARVLGREDWRAGFAKRSRSFAACRIACNGSPKRAACSTSTIRRARRSRRREAALAGIGRPVVLIAGGDGKGQSFVPLKPAVDRACKAVLLIGRDAPLVARGLAGTTAHVESVGTLDAAVTRAFELAAPGDAVLLSPACASLDQFASYGERGERFAALVRDRAEGAPLVRKRLSRDRNASHADVRWATRQARNPRTMLAWDASLAWAALLLLALGRGDGLLVVDRDGGGVARTPAIAPGTSSRATRRSSRSASLPHRWLSRSR